MKPINDVSNLKTEFFKEETVCLDGLPFFGMTRASTKTQGDKNTHGIQEGWIISKCKELSLNITSSSIYSFNETGFYHKKRKKFMKIVNDLIKMKAHTGVFVIVLYDTSRASRNRESKIVIDKMVLDHGFVFVFTCENLILHKNSPNDDWRKWANCCDVNMQYSEKVRRNAVEGHWKCIERGIWPGRAPFGYRNYIFKDDTSGFVLIPELVPYLRKAFELFSTGSYTIEHLKKRLDQLFAGVIKKKLPTAKNLGKILRNHFYYGDFVYRKNLYHGNRSYHPNVISKHLWLKVQSILNKNPTKRNDNKHPYIGLIKCGGHRLDSEGKKTDLICGKAISGDPQKGSYYWRCSSSQEYQCCFKDNNYLEENNITKESIKDDNIENFFQRIFQKIVFTEDILTWIRDFSKKIIFDENEYRENSIRALKANITKKEKLANDLFKAKYEANSPLEKGKIELNYKEVCDEVEALKKKQTKLLSEESAQNSRLDAIIELFKDFQSMFESSSQSSKANLILALTENRKLRMTELSADYKNHISWIINGGNYAKK